MAIVRIFWPLGWFESGKKKMGIFETSIGEPSVAAVASKITETDWALLVAEMGSEQAVIDSLGVNDIYDQSEEI